VLCTSKEKSIEKLLVMGSQAPHANAKGANEEASQSVKHDELKADQQMAGKQLLASDGFCSHEKI